MSSSNGGISQLASVAMMPMQDANTGVCGLYAFDPLYGFNDPINASSHSFKAEEIQHGRTPTIKGLILTYRNLGVVTVSFTITGNNDAGETSSAVLTATIGSVAATNRIVTTVFNSQSVASTFPISVMNPQLTVYRAPNAGPLSITKITLYGRVERAEYS
jgi:hypothetical protein